MNSTSPDLARIFNGAALRSAAEARRVCDLLCTAQPDLPRLRTIAAVGAYDADIGGKSVDSRRLTRIMSYLLRSGVLIDPDFSVDVVNFAQKRDFLHETDTADLLFVSFILHSPSNMTMKYGDWLHGIVEEEGERETFGLALSADHSLAAWRARTAATRAKMLVTYGGSDEIGTATLGAGEAGNALVPVIASPNARIAHYAVMGANGYWDMERAVNIRAMYNDRAADVPMPWLGFAMERTYLQQMQPAFAAQTTLLARRALTAQPS